MEDISCPDCGKQEWTLVREQTRDPYVIYTGEYSECVCGQRVMSLKNEGITNINHIIALQRRVKELEGLVDKNRTIK